MVYILEKKQLIVPPQRIDRGRRATNAEVLVKAARRQSLGCHGHAHGMDGFRLKIRREL